MKQVPNFTHFMGYTKIGDETAIREFKLGPKDRVT